MSDSRNWFAPVEAARQRRFAASTRHRTGIEVDGRRLVNFASNDYLGLSWHPHVVQAMARCIAERGLGSGASRLVSGDDPLLHRLERRLAAWKGYEACLIAGSGMLANIGLLHALADRHTRIFSDRLNHASLIDGGRLAGAAVHRYAHRDLAALASLLERHAADRRIIVSDGVFSMDGDCADVAGLVAMAEAHDALLLIDDAHGIGCLDSQGRGLTGADDVAGHARLVEVGTFGKAFGGYGAFILGTGELIEGLRQRLRTMIYSTALPPAVIAAADAALDLIREGCLTAQLQERIAHFRSRVTGLPLMDSQTAIQPLLVGSDAAASAAADALRERGFFVPAIRPPTVPEGTARLRITLSAAHAPEQIDALAAALEHVA